MPGRGDILRAICTTQEHLHLCTQRVTSYNGEPKKLRQSLSPRGRGQQVSDTASTISPISQRAGPPLITYRSAGWQPPIERNRGATPEDHFGLFTMGSGIDMTSYSHRSTSEASAAPNRTGPDMTAATFCFTRQVVHCGTGSIRRDCTMHQPGNKLSGIPFTLPAEGVQGATRMQKPGRMPGLPTCGYRAMHNTCHSEQRDSLEKFKATGIPGGCFTSDTDSGHRCRERRRHAYRLSRTA
jgi:hypothetical protein